MGSKNQQCPVLMDGSLFVFLHHFIYLHNISHKSCPCSSVSLSTVPGRLREGCQPAADPTVLRPGRVQRRAHGEAPGRSAEADPSGGGEAHRDGRAGGLQQDLQHPVLRGVHHHEPRGHRSLAAHRRDDRSLLALCGGPAAGGMTGRETPTMT